ncbi:MAG: glycoside hydrolase family 2 TIM barrel-domain containing protein [Planctomycetota bacterium]
MRYKTVIYTRFIFLALSIIFLLPDDDLYAQVNLLVQDGNYSLQKDGERFPIRGVGGSTNLELLKHLGGNSIRTWGEDGETLQRILDQADGLGIAVCVGIWLEHERHGFNYGDEDAVSKQFKKSIEIVQRFKDHPAVLLWGIGNEMEGDGTDPLIWQAVNQIAARIKQIDPLHPTMTVIDELGRDSIKLKNVQKLCPDIEIVGINSYGGMLTLAERYRQSGVRLPYIVTEHGPRGPWETEKTSWGSAIEDSNFEKAKLYKTGYQSTAIAHSELCLGTYAFLWGHKQETTATWFGMLLPDGSRLQAADTMSKLWSGKSVKNKCPIIKEIKLDSSSDLVSGDTISATVETFDPENDRLKIVWKLRLDSQTIGVGGDFQKSIADIESAVVSDGHRANITIPNEGNQFRLFVYIYDGNGGADVANVCFKTNLKN